MKHSRQETFFWLKAASLLDRVSVADDREGWDVQSGHNVVQPSLIIGEDPKQVSDLSRVRHSRQLARWILACLARRQVSIDELDSGANEASEMRVGPLQVGVKKYALAHIGATGNTADRVVAYALKRGIITDDDVCRAKRKRKRHPAYEPERIGTVARFLVDYWCGEEGVYGQARSLGIFFMPPLCFFSNGALATFCALALGKKQSDPDTSETAVRKLVSRLQLERPQQSSAPKIRDVKLHGDEILFCR